MSSDNAPFSGKVLTPFTISQSVHQPLDAPDLRNSVEVHPAKIFNKPDIDSVNGIKDFAPAIEPVEDEEVGSDVDAPKVAASSVTEPAISSEIDTTENGTQPDQMTQMHPSTQQVNADQPATAGKESSLLSDSIDLMLLT